MKPIIKFQSTHPRRVWHNFYFLLSLCTCFNPHTHAGCDSGRRAMRDAGSGFNPHTHAGCDKNQHLYLIPQICFNPHTHAGCDYYQCFDLHIRMFQSTHPRRVWPWSIFYNTRVIGFNPHTHAGCDSFHLRSSQRPRMFQSTHPRRVWHFGSKQFFRAQVVSIHTPTQGVTWSVSCAFMDKEVSIHTPTQGVTRVCFSLLLLLPFQSTHPRRVWLYI